MKNLWILIIALLASRTALAQPATPDSFIAAYAAEHNFNGTILIQKDGDVTFARSFGLANLPFKVPNTQQTKYKIASITKLFTSTLILQLHEQGKIDLNKTVGTYLPDYAGEGADKVTVHQLLNHTSGLANFDTVKDMETALASGIPVYQTPYTSDQLLARFCAGKLVNPPGKVFDYNNADYIVLGKIVERVYGAPYERVLRDRILQPLGMKNTGMLHQSDIVEGLADTYFFRDDLKALVPDLPVYPENWYAAGAMYSTAADLLTFANALFGGKLLKKETLALMVTPGLDDYGYGLWSYETKINGRKHRVVKRPGRIMGAQTQLYHFLDDGVTIVILSNTGTTDLDEFVAEIGRKVVG
ncbi:MAG TPA: serine hydrolase domain-containing protein [Thermoanaerobaculia bacterium]